MWGRSPLLAIVDDRISHFAFRVCALFAVKSLHGSTIYLSHAEIAVAMNCSERQAIRVVRELERYGYLEVSRQHNRRNEYSLALPKTAPAARAGESRPSDVCTTCGKERTRFAASGDCYPCARRANIRRQVAEILERDPTATDEEVYVRLKTKRAKEIRAALQLLRGAA
jgi:hypothetical protein